MLRAQLCCPADPAVPAVDAGPQLSTIEWANLTAVQHHYLQLRQAPWRWENGGSFCSRSRS